MNEHSGRNDAFTQLHELLNQLEQLAPHPEDVQGNRVTFRILPEVQEVVNDALESLDEGSEAEELGWQAEEVKDFRSVRSGPVVAIDSGIIRLGETQDGLIIALRGCAAILDKQGQVRLNLFRSGPLYLRNRDKLEILHLMGCHLGKEDFFIAIDESTNVPQAVKRGVAEDSHQYGDRFRNWFERLIQWEAVSSISNGVILLDGALTLRTRDTPQIFLERLAERASDCGNALVAISKQSRLQVNETPITFLLDDHPGRVCYRPVSPILQQQDPTRAERVLGNIYVARLSPVGPSFRIDIKHARGQSDDEALNQFFSSCLMRVGYPDILVRAHTHSYFTRADVLELQAQVRSRFGLEPKGDVDLSTIFTPFGGRFK
jgi:hypothetical protein